MWLPWSGIQALPDGGMWCEYQQRPADEGRLIIGTFEAVTADHFDHQVRRETRGGVLAFRAATTESDLKNWSVILRNDATGALSTLRKGCYKSEFM